MLPVINLRKIRESLGTTQEGVARRTRGIGLRTYIRAESGKRVTYETAYQILDAINEILSEASKPTVTLDDLGLTLY
jgi:predicted transcriptional regulator